MDDRFGSNFVPRKTKVVGSLAAIPTSRASEHPIEYHHHYEALISAKVSDTPPICPRTIGEPSYASNRARSAKSFARCTHLRS
jgi:hypothetical protein